MSDKKFELTDLSSGKKSLLPVHTGSIGPDVIDVAAINNFNNQATTAMAQFDTLTK